MKSHQTVKKQPQQGGHGALWLDPGDGAWSGGSRIRQLQRAVCVGASFPSIPGRKGDALQPSCKAEFRLFRVRPGMLFYQTLAYPEHCQLPQANKILLL